MNVASTAVSRALGKQRSLWVDAWVQFRKHKLAMFGLATLVFLILFSFAGPLVYTREAEFIDIVAANQQPNWDHPFGTDMLGRDTLARVMAGGRISLAVGLSAMLVAIVLGTVIGGLSGFYSKLDDPLMRLTDMFLALPLLPLLLVIIMLFRDTLRAAFGPEMGIFMLIVFVIGILNWMPTARVVRAQVLAVKEQEFVLAAVQVGARQFRILARHILPNVMSPIIVAATLGVANAILTESALSFLGWVSPLISPPGGGCCSRTGTFCSSCPFW